MDLTLAITIIGVLVAVVFGFWTIYYARKQANQSTNTVSSPSVAPQSANKLQAYQRKLEYELKIPIEPSQIPIAFYGWEFSSYPIKTDWSALNGVLTLGTEDCTAGFQLPLPEILNCSVEFKVRIKPSVIHPLQELDNWAGVRVRGQLEDFSNGYLVYLRRAGAVELHTSGITLEGKKKRIVSDTSNFWTNIRFDIFESEMRVYVNGNLHINREDKRIGGQGFISLHTYVTIAEFKEIRVYTLTP